MHSTKKVDHRAQIFMTLFSTLTPDLKRLIGGHVCLHAAMAGMRMAVPLWALKQGFSAATVGVLVALFALTQVFIALPSGRYVDRHGMRKPLSLAILATSAGAAVAAVYPHVLSLMMAALLMGGAAGLGVIAVQRHAGRAAQSHVQLKQAFSWISIGPAASNFLGPLMAGVLIDFVGYRAAFAAMALLPWVCWFLMQPISEPASYHTDQPHHQSPWRSAWQMLSEPMFRRLLLVNLMLSASWDVHGFVVPLIGHERDYSASVIGMILGAFAIAAAAIRVALPLLAHSLREWAVITCAMLMTSMLLAVYPLMPTALSMGVVSVFLGFTLGTVQPMIMSTLHQITPEERHGEAIALRMMTINSSSVAMPMLFGLAGAALGTAALFWMAAVIVGVGASQAVKLKLV
jgi:MFS family permease